MNLFSKLQRFNYFSGSCKNCKTRVRTENTLLLFLHKIVYEMHTYIPIGTSVNSKSIIINQKNCRLEIKKMYSAHVHKNNNQCLSNELKTDRKKIQAFPI